MNLSPIRKVFQGVADRHQMFRMFDRHAQRPNRTGGDDGALYRGEWFEIGQVEHDYMFEILPPLWIRGDMFALREFLTGSITSIFFTLPIDSRIRYFHGYCDLSDTRSPARMRNAIIDRESRPVKAMTREERIEHVWSATADRYRGYAGAEWAEVERGSRIVQCFGGRNGPSPQILNRMSDAALCAKLPVHLRYLPEAIAA